jgi:hypothetical protein
VHNAIVHQHRKTVDVGFLSDILDRDDARLVLVGLLGLGDRVILLAAAGNYD